MKYILVQYSHLLCKVDIFRSSFDPISIVESRRANGGLYSGLGQPGKGYEKSLSDIKATPKDHKEGSDDSCSKANTESGNA